MNRKSLVVGILIGMAIVGCIAAVTGDDGWAPVVEGGKYGFHGISYWIGSNQTVSAVLPNGWIQTTDGKFINMKLVDSITAAP